MSNYSKPFLTYEDQLEKLKTEKKLRVPHEKFGIEILKSISYYDLINGYKSFFMEDEKYIDNIDQTTLFLFSIFDKNFQNILFKYSVYVEHSLKTKLSHVLAKEFGVHESHYLDKRKYPKQFSSTHEIKLINTLKTIEDILQNDKTGDPTKHYKNKHNHVPPWIVFKNISFNTTIDLYSFLKIEHKVEIFDNYFSNPLNLTDREKTDLFKNMISIVRKFRNVIAHNLNFIGYSVLKNRIPQNILIKVIPSNFSKNSDIKEGKGKNDLFAMIISLVFTLGNKYLIISMLNELAFLLKSDTKISEKYIKITNLPEDIVSRLEELIIYYRFEFEKEYKNEE